MDINLRTVEDKRYFEGMEVSVNGNIVTISDGVFHDLGDSYNLPGISFALEKPIDVGIEYRVFIVEKNGKYAYDVAMAYRSNDYMIHYEGSAKLIHEFVRISLLPSTEGRMEVNRFVKSKDGKAEVAGEFQKRDRTKRGKKEKLGTEG